METYAFQPLYDRILVRPKEQDERTQGGIIIPDVAKERPREGLVLEVGTGRLLEDGSLRPLQVEPGDMVLFAKYAGSDIELGGEKLLILSEAEVLGKMVRIEPDVARKPTVAELEEMLGGSGGKVEILPNGEVRCIPT